MTGQGSTDYTSKTITATYDGNIYNCGIYVYALPSTVPDWITTTRPSSGSVTLNVSENGTNTTRHANITVGIRKNQYVDEVLCPNTIYITQEPKCGCGIYNNRPTYYSPVYYGGIVAQYQLTNSGDCLSYSVSCDNPDFVASYTESHLSYDRVDVSIQDNTTSTGCSSGNITFNIYTDGTLCYTDTFEVASIRNCNEDPGGSLSQGETAFTMDTSEHTIGSITNYDGGLTGYGCYSLSSHTLSTQYFDSINIVPNGTNYDIKVKLVNGISEQTIAPTIDLYIMREDVCGDGSIKEYNALGSIQLYITK